MSETVAVIDVGSNSIKLLVARIGAFENNLETLFSKTIETRISTGISQENPSLCDEAIEAGTRTITDLQALAQSYEPTKTAVVATSAVRDAINAETFRQAVYDTTGLLIRILSGKEEASYIGKGLSYDPAIRGMSSFIQTDIGGGSLELIRFENGKIVNALSLQLGAVRLCEKFIPDREAPLSQELEAKVRTHVYEQLEASKFNFSPQILPLIATGGAYTISRTLLAAKTQLDMEHSSPRLERSMLDQLKSELAPLALSERIKTLHLPSARADILPTALVTIDTLLNYSGRDHVIHSLYNLRYGIAANLLYPN